MSRILDVYLHDIKIGKLSQGESARLSFKYNDDYLNSPDPKALSVALPLQNNVYDDRITRPFFSGLLPDDILLSRLAKYLGISEKNPFALLESVGGECAGAVSLYPEGQKPEDYGNTELVYIEDDKLVKILNLLKTRPMLAGEKGIRLSLAGAQDKLAVRVIENKIAIIKGNLPTTHILKPEITGVEDSVYNELFCMKLAQEMKINVPKVSIKYSENQPLLLIERYDRTAQPDGTIVRLHQEDFCQALSIPPELRYQREGGPAVNSCLEIIDTYSRQPALDRLNFLKLLIFNYIIGNADAHGKNFSLLYQRSKPQLAPAYDLISTAVYPHLSDRMAMKIGSKYKPENVLLRHWHSMIPDKAAAKNVLEKELKQQSYKIPETAKILSEKLQNRGIKSEIIEKVITVIDQRTKHIVQYFKFE